MNISGFDLSTEFWKCYLNILQFFGLPGEQPDVSLIMVFLLGSALLFLGTLIFFMWLSYLEEDKSKYVRYAEDQDFPSTSGTCTSVAILYERPEARDSYDLEVSQMAQGEIHETSVIINGFLVPEHVTSRQSSLRGTQLLL